MRGVQDGVQDGGLERVDIPEAARRMATTPEAIRKRIRRGTLRAAKQDGRWYVLLDASRTRSYLDRTQDAGQDASDAALAAVNATLGRVLEESRRLSEQNVQLAGRVGWLESELQSAREKIALLEAPPTLEFSNVAAHTPWWRFWRRSQESATP